jgi:2',3'-cyclic-nucleotide 2'-phosphodiesterase / 3'-nucleotidase
VGQSLKEFVKKFFKELKESLEMKKEKEKFEKITIIYTSDVHGSILSYDFSANKSGQQGLTKLSRYLKTLKTPYLLLDNGDVLQGNVVLEYHLKNKKNDLNPATKAMNLLNYHYATLGNHDFNYGLNHLNNHINNLNAKIICANVLDKKGNNLFAPHAILELNGIKIGLIGAVTHYIPNFEKKENIVGLVFKDAYQSIKEQVTIIRNQVDVVVVLYHGGFEKDILSGQQIGRPTSENQGYKISKIKGLDLLLTGHQHVPQVYNLDGKKSIIQTGLNASDFGVINLEFKDRKLSNVKADLIKNIGKDDLVFNQKFAALKHATNNWLDVSLSKTKNELKIKDPLSCRVKKHLLFQYINQLQLMLTGADISAASLPNYAPGFNSKITRRDVESNFVFPNSIIKLEITGKILKDALEKSATYFERSGQEIKISKSFLSPKVEHYNYDVYDNITYEIEVNAKVGSKIKNLKYKGKQILPNQKLTLALNNYRANGGGDYVMFKGAKVLKEYDVTIASLVIQDLTNKPELELKLVENFKVY